MTGLDKDLTPHSGAVEWPVTLAKQSSNLSRPVSALGTDLYPEEVSFPGCPRTKVCLPCTGHSSMTACGRDQPIQAGCPSRGGDRSRRIRHRLPDEGVEMQCLAGRHIARYRARCTPRSLAGMHPATWYEAIRRHGPDPTWRQGSRPAEIPEMFPQVVNPMSLSAGRQNSSRRPCLPLGVSRAGDQERTSEMSPWPEPLFFPPA